MTSTRWIHTLSLVCHPLWSTGCTHYRYPECLIHSHCVFTCIPSSRSYRIALPYPECLKHSHSVSTHVPNHYKMTDTALPLTRHCHWHGADTDTVLTLVTVLTLSLSQLLTLVTSLLRECSRYDARCKCLSISHHPLTTWDPQSRHPVTAVTRPLSPWHA